MKKDALTIPHPRMYKRGFVLRPICDIEPDFIHPVLWQDMKALLSLVENDPGQEVGFPKRQGVSAIINGQEVFFCSQECKDKYLGKKG